MVHMTDEDFYISELDRIHGVIGFIATCCAIALPLGLALGQPAMGMIFYLAGAITTLVPKNFKKRFQGKISNLDIKYYNKKLFPNAWRWGWISLSTFLVSIFIASPIALIYTYR